MLYRMIIVDDEPIISEYMKKIYDWEMMGFSVVKTFTDGESALDYIDNNEVDIVLSDIRMNSVSGIDIARYVYENEIPAKMVLMSAYQEFEYAHKAISYKVENYLIKPINPGELEEIFAKIKSVLDEECIRKYDSSVSEQVDYMAAILKRQFFTDVMLGTIKNKSLIDTQLKFLNIEIDAEKAICKEIYIKIVDYNKLMCNDSIYNIYNELGNFLEGKEDGVTLYIVNFVRNYIHVISVFEGGVSNETGNEVLKNILNKKMSIVHDGINIDLVVERIGDFKKFTDMRFFDKDIDMIFSNELFMTYINECHREKAYMYFLNTIEGLYIDDIEKIKLYVLKWYDIILMDKRNKENYIPYKSNEFKNNIKNAATTEEINEQISQMINTLISNIENQNEKYYTGIISDAIEYVKSNLQRQISLEEVAMQVYLNPVYFSRLFKEKTEITFLEYQKRLKMEKAKELLVQHKYKIYEIGEMIGYSSNQHFRRLFKEYTGLTPIEYRNRLGDSE